MPVKKKDTDRALALLEDYCKMLKKPEEQQLKKAIKKVMGIFKSSLFQALLATVTAYNPYRQEEVVPSGLVRLMSNHRGPLFNLEAWFPERRNRRKETQKPNQLDYSDLRGVEVTGQSSCKP